jgi:hypothetical protein
MKSLLQLTSLALLIAVTLSKELPRRHGIPDAPSQFALDPDRLPENSVVVEGGTVTLSCAAEEPSTDHSIEWLEFITNANGNPISANEVIGNHPERDRYTIIHSDEFEYSLRISPVLLSDGGTYQCRDGAASAQLKRQHQLELTVVAPDLNCSSTIHENGIVLDNSYQTNDCGLTFQGGLIPNMTWSGPLPFGQLYIASPTTAWAGMQFNVTRDMDTRAHVMTTHFTGYFLPVDANKADNVPDFTIIYQARQMFVYWGPTNMLAAPIKIKYEVGDVIICTADAFPPPSYFWQNLRTNQITAGATVTVDSAWQGFNQSMRCEARNTIESTIYSNNIFVPVDVNVVTTPTTTLPPTTTTPPPAEAPCTDLSGAWVSTTPTNGSLCIKINTLQRGLLTGLLKNATDTYWVDIVGRSQEDRFDQVGFNGIWPADIGVSSFIGECHRCFGVEQLLVNVVSRNKGPPCGNPGWIRYTTQYDFRRSTTLQCPNLPAL